MIGHWAVEQAYTLGLAWIDVVVAGSAHHFVISRGIRIRGPGCGDPHSPVAF